MNRLFGSIHQRLQPSARARLQNTHDRKGSIAGLFGGRNAPTSAYAGFRPIFGWDDTLGGYVGGIFWNGRATGEELGDPLAEQACGPFLNPVEMGFEKMEVVDRVSAATYASLFETVFRGTDWENENDTSNNIARAIAAFERSQTVTRFNSKFDLFWKACVKAGIDVSAIGVTIDPTAAPQGILSTGELKGLAVFNGKAGCAGCHTSVDFEAGVVPPLFNDCTYANIGIPINDTVYELTGEEPPQDGDLGLGGRLTDEPAQNGKFNVPDAQRCQIGTLRPHRLLRHPGRDRNFFNERDVPGSLWYNIDPDVPENVNTTDMGNLGLSAREESWIVAFLNTLTDQPQ